MPALNIPERYHSGIQKIATLSAGTLEVLVAALNGISPSVSGKDRASAIKAKVGGIGQEDLDLILRTLDSLYQVRAHLETPPDQFTLQVIEAVRAAKAVTMASTQEQSDFQSRLTRLLSA